MRALIVDDSRAIRRLVCKYVRGLGLATLEATNGQEALEVLKKHGGIKLALVDWNMPVMNGYEFVKSVRADPQYADVRLVMVTTETEMDRVLMALEAGADEYVMKPFTPEVLGEKLQMLGIPA